MLKVLSIENLGIIPELSVTFGSELNVLTGETGVGKSMILSAVNLIGGAKASESMIKSGEEKMLVIGVFDFNGYPEILKALEKEEIDLDGTEVEIRRLVHLSGKNKVYINDTPVKLSVLKDLAQHWFDIHGQNDSHSLINNEEQLSYLDAFGVLEGKVVRYQKHYSAWFSLTSELKRLEEVEAREAKEAELLRFQVDELEKASLSEGEDDELDEEYRLLTHIEQIKEACYLSGNVLEEAEDSAVTKISAAKKELEKVASFDKRLETLISELDSIIIQVSEAASECSAIFEGAEYDKGRLTEVEERVSFLQGLKNKYSLDLNGLIQFLDEIRKKCESSEQRGEEKEALKGKIEEEFARLQETGVKLAELREKKAKEFEKEIMREMAPLNMEKAIFQVTFLYEEDEQGALLQGKKYAFGERGIGSLRFDISTNPGEPVKPLHEVVSGGELSRIMLSVKSMLSKKDDLPTLIFDEIDTGIGGKTAHTIGEKLKAIAESRQVITISHLPQIAVKAKQHYRIEKSYSGNRTDVAINFLSDEQRIEELKRMLGDDNDSEASTEFVLNMLKKQ